ncbi:MAG TPA: hypothetical protein PLU22_07075, partial [Polyangiaceae bacterium]|nr:hypothetical protein [Polyangiaceae bacterium]
MTALLPPAPSARIGVLMATLLAAGLARGAPPAGSGEPPPAPASPSGSAPPSGDAPSPPPPAAPPTTAEPGAVPADPAAASDPTVASPSPDPAAVVRACVTRHGEAQEHRLEGRLVEARRALVDCGRADCPGPVRADCAAWEAEVARSIPTVVVAARSPRGDEVEVRVLVDGVPLRERLDGGAIEVDPGAHRFRFELVGQRPIELSLVMHEGEKNRRVEVDFAPPATPAPAPEPAPAAPDARLPVLAFWLGGVALASAAVGTGFGASALETRDQHRRQCAPLCDEDDEREVRSRAIVADVSFGLALV